MYAELNEPTKHRRTKGAEDNTQILSRGVGSERGARRLGTDSGRHSAGTFALSCYRHYTSAAARCASGRKRQPAGLLSSASSDFFFGPITPVCVKLGVNTSHQDGYTD